MKIKTRHYAPPIPLRQWDWSAIDAETYDEGGPCGFGKTEIAAVIDLMHQMQDELEAA